MSPFLYCTTFILLGSWGGDLSWLFLALPAHSPFLLTPQGLLCAWPLAALAVALAYAKYTFGKLFFHNQMVISFPTINSQGW